MTPLFAILSAALWGSLALLAHTYAVYPLLMRRLARGRSLPAERHTRPDALPEATVLMAVYNEEAVLETTLASILASDYPAEKLRILVGSDGSTDASDAIATRLAAADPRLRLVRFSGRNGKIRILNQLAESALAAFDDPGTALLVPCDANVAWTPGLLRQLASHFKRDRVGLVAPAVRDRTRRHDGIGDEEEAYVGQENLVKFAEGVLWGRVMGAFGACYAMRAKLFSPVPPEHIVDDFYLTLSVLEQGRDAIVDLDAVCHEAVSTDIREEFRRKRRIAAGNFQNLRRFRSFLRPWNGGPAAAFAFWSHKGLRWCGPLLLLAAFLSAAALSVFHPIHLLPLGAFVGLFAMALADRALETAAGPRLRILRLARYFLSMNFAIFLGLVDFLRGPRGSVWEPTRRVAPSGEPESRREAALPR